MVDHAIGRILFPTGTRIGNHEEDSLGNGRRQKPSSKVATSPHHGHPETTSRSDAMTDFSGLDEIKTAEEFERVLEKLLTAATSNGIDLRGSWVYRDIDGSSTSWEVLVSELE